MLASLLLLAATAASCSATTHIASYIPDGRGGFKVVEGKHSAALATAMFEDTGNTTGWGVLNVKTAGSSADSILNDTQKMYAAGYLEGYLTFDHIYDTYLNLKQALIPNGLPDNFPPFMDKQSVWTRAQVLNHPSSDYWRQVGLIDAQFQGLKQAIKDAGLEDKYAADLLNLAGDILDLMPALDPSKRLDWFNMDKKDFMRNIANSGHCSALVRVPDDFSDLYISQVAWFTYGAMDRIYKHYDFTTLAEPSLAAPVMSFSSYPGMLESLDDFYIMSSKLVMIQTTNSVLDASLFSLVTHDALYAWQRVRLANAMAKTGRQWFELFKDHNSGTYNNQYMVIDLKLFTPNMPLADDLLWVIEQIPGYVEGADSTNLLRLGYWASYNVPYFKTTYDRSGYPEAVKAHGADASYSMAPRAKIFRRDHVKAVDFESFKELMRSNDFETDKFSEGSTFNAICSRGDLNTPPAYGGCYDGKVTSFARALDMQSEAVNGPTRGRNGTQYPPFDWASAAGSPQLHYGQPQVFDFQYVKMQPRKEL